MKINKYLLGISAVLMIMAVTIGFSACSDILKVEDDDVLSPDQVYRNSDDANAAIRGIYGKLMDVASQYVVLNELRADLMDVTANADLALVELSRHMEISSDNEWASPKKFFELINNCNDVIKNFKIMYDKKIISREEFNPRYSDVVAVRCWAYLQVALHFADPEKGGVPYITEPLDNVDAVSEKALAQYSYLDLSTMVDTLLNTMEAIPYKKKYTDSDLLQPIAGYSADQMYIDKEYLLGELNLWQGNYHRAAEYFKTIMERGTSGNDLYDLYKLPFDASATLDQSSCRYNSGYIRYYQNDRLSAKNMWPLMFFEIQSNNYNNEWIWTLFYDGQSEINPFVELFSKSGGKYLLQPSQLAIDNWNNEAQRNGFMGDFRGYYQNYFGLTGSYDMVSGEPVIAKFISNHMYSSTLPNQGRWFLWRAGGLHLHYCEAANRDGQHKVAYALMNNGISATFLSKYPDATNNYTDSTLRGQTGLPFPYNFDARSTGVSDLPPNLRQPWFRNTGLRNRVYLPNRNIVYDITETDPAQKELAEQTLTRTMEDSLIYESGLELAFEGQRWADLVRISLRRGRESGDYSYLSQQVAKKLEKAGVSAPARDLTDPKNWFLPLKY
ncbi:MAG: RagB/SusD family nutrient uptake outer membrane protein [Breznakibacter sp.]